MKNLQDKTVQYWDDLTISFEIKGTEKPIVFCIKDNNEELYYAPMKKNWDVYTIEVEEDVFSSIDKGEYTYSVRIQEKPKTTIGKGKLTIE